jgi:hypothetical protein
VRRVEYIGGCHLLCSVSELSVTIISSLMPLSQMIISTHLLSLR